MLTLLCIVLKAVNKTTALSHAKVKVSVSVNYITDQLPGTERLHGYRLMTERCRTERLRVNYKVITIKTDFHYVVIMKKVTHLSQDNGPNEKYIKIFMAFVLLCLSVNDLYLAKSGNAKYQTAIISPWHVLTAAIWFSLSVLKTCSRRKPIALVQLWEGIWRQICGSPYVTW